MNEMVVQLPIQRHDTPDYTALARLRRGIGEIESFLHAAGGRYGCTASMYQLLLTVKTVRRGRELDIGMIANALVVRHPSAAEMVRKAEAAGFLASSQDDADRRRVLIDLTQAGERVLQDVAQDHLDELRRLRPTFIAALKALD